MTAQKLLIGADGIGVYIDLTEEELKQQAIDQTASQATDITVAADAAALTKQLAADTIELDTVDVSKLQAALNQITTERANIATALTNLPASPTAAQFRAALVSIAGILDNQDARQAFILRALAVLRKRSG